MAYFSFAEAIMAGRPITVYDDGTLKRDFTYIDDIIAGVIGVIDHPPAAPVNRLFNIGNCRSELVGDLVEMLEKALDRKAIIETAPKPAADPLETRADIAALTEVAGFMPKTLLSEGVPRFVSWYLRWREHVA